MIDRQCGKILVRCESCDEVLKTGTGDFAEACALMKREGWKVRRIASLWLHGCTKCGIPSDRRLASYVESGLERLREAVGYYEKMNATHRSGGKTRCAAMRRSRSCCQR
jgi:hypothetical protein